MCWLPFQAIELLVRQKKRLDACTISVSHLWLTGKSNNLRDSKQTWLNSRPNHFLSFSPKCPTKETQQSPMPRPTAVPGRKNDRGSTARWKIYLVSTFPPCAQKRSDSLKTADKEDQRDGTIPSQKNIGNSTSLTFPAWQMPKFSALFSLSSI